MGFSQAITSVFSKYVGFSGRAARSEYWYWALFMFLLSLVTGIADFAVFGDSLGEGTSPINSIVNLLLFLPSLAVSFRRLHDIDRTAWWLLLTFSIIGIVVLIYWACVKGTEGPNRFGPDPLAPKS